MATSGAGGKSAAPADTVRRYTVDQLMGYRTKYLAPSEDVFEALRSAGLEHSHAQDTLVLPAPVARQPSQQRRENQRCAHRAEAAAVWQLTGMLCRASKQDRVATGSRDRGAFCACLPFRARSPPSRAGHSNKQLNDADPEWMHFPVGDKPASAPDAIVRA